jgi:hypothetical protein
VTLLHGDCVPVMEGMEPASVDAVVTDPPYGIGFMGKDWDRMGAKLRGSAERIGILPTAIPALIEEVERLREGVKRLASPDEMAGMGVTEEMTGGAAVELRARMSYARALLEAESAAVEEIEVQGAAVPAQPGTLGTTGPTSGRVGRNAAAPARQEEVT